MQNMAQPATSKGNSGQSVIVTAFLLFALAGGIMGFAVGTFAHHTQSQPPAQTNTSTNPNSHKTATPVAQPSPTVTAVATPQKFTMQAPTDSPPSASGTSTYTFTAISANGAPLTADGLTCHLAIIKGNAQQRPNINQGLLKNIATIDTMQPGEVDGVTYDPSTPKTQSCQKGVGTWTITPKPDLVGTYYVVGIIDWGGTTYYWSWGILVHQKQS